MVCLRRGFCPSQAGLQDLYADLRIYISPFGVLAAAEFFGTVPTVWNGSYLFGGVADNGSGDFANSS